MDAIEAILSRVSSVRLTSPGPDAAQLDIILRAGVAAPDHGRIRPWRFAVLSGEARAPIADAFERACLAHMPDASPERRAQERAKADRAPTIIAVAAHFIEGTKISEIEQVMSAAAAVQNMFVAAHALGLGAMWKTGAITDDPVLKQALGLAERDCIVAFLYLGVPAGRPEPAPRSYDGLVITG
jgi:nitroreductase